MKPSFIVITKLLNALEQVCINIRLTLQKVHRIIIFAILLLSLISQLFLPL